MPTTKVDFINGAYSLMRINGLTVGPDNFALSTGLKRLENLAYFYEYTKNIRTGYNFTENPDLNDYTNVPAALTMLYESNLALLLCNDFGTEIPQALKNMADSTLASASAMSALSNAQYINHPNRMPVGSGNTLRWAPFNTFYRDLTQPPPEASTNNLYVGDVNIYEEDYTQYLRSGETILSYVLTADPGLTVTNDALTTPVITYTVEGVNTQQSGNWQQVKIVATTSLGRVNTRLINFNVIQANTVGSN